MSAPPPPWLMVSQSFFEGVIYDAQLQPWQRVYAAAMARCGSNLHAEFESGELSTLLGKNHPDGFKPMSAQQLCNAIATAKMKGYIEATSNTRCLVLPDTYVGSSLRGSHTPCPTHTGKASKPRRMRTATPSSVKIPATQPGNRESERERAEMRRSARRILPKVHSHSELASLSQ